MQLVTLQLRYLTVGINVRGKGMAELSNSTNR